MQTPLFVSLVRSPLLQELDKSQNVTFVYCLRRFKNISWCVRVANLVVNKESIVAPIKTLHIFLSALSAAFSKFFSLYFKFLGEPCQTE